MNRGFTDFLSNILLILSIFLTAVIMVTVINTFWLNPSSTPRSDHFGNSRTTNNNNNEIKPDDKPKPVPTSIRYWGGDPHGPGLNLDRELVKDFQSKTGIKVDIMRKTSDVPDAYDELEGILKGNNPPDVTVLDVIWVHAFAEHFRDLKELNLDTDAHDPEDIANNTVQGKLVAMPWFVDVGLLYYRTDLLEKYGDLLKKNGYSPDRPPTTWEDLEKMAKIIQDGERAEGKSDFWGFVWQNKEEALTCNVLEWIASSGGTIIKNGEITINNNDNARKALERAQGWIREISPSDLDYTESKASETFRKGNAAFMRNWPTAYSDSKPESVDFDFDIAPLPSNKDVKPVGTYGGSAIGIVNTDTMDAKKVEDAKKFVEYMTGNDAQEKRANEGFFIPTRPAIFSGRDGSRKLNNPKIKDIVTIINNEIKLVYRPSKIAGKKYKEASKIIYEGVYSILKEEGADVDAILSDIEKTLQATLPPSAP